MANRHAAIGKNSCGGGRSMRDDDFDEEDVWAVMKERKDSSPRMRKSLEYCSGSSSSSSSAWRLPTAPRGIRRGINTPSHEAKPAHHSSAPMNIPDWSKIYRKNSRAMPWIDDVEDGNEAGNTHQVCIDDDDDDGGGEDDDMVPPHEWIARKLASSQISSFSVCEGIGRTLKGRDLSKVRNAVLTKTGFLE